METAKREAAAEALAADPEPVSTTLMLTFGLANPSPSFLLYFFSGVLIALFLVNKSRAVASKACVLRFGKLSLLFDLRILKLCISTSVLLFLLFLFGLETGEYPIPRLKAIAIYVMEQKQSV